MKADEDFGLPIAKLQGSNYFLFDNGVIGTKHFFPRKYFTVEYYHVSETLSPQISRYNDKTKRLLFLRDWKLGTIYAIVLYLLFYLNNQNLLLIPEIPTIESVENWGFPLKFFTSLCLFIIVLGLPEFIFEAGTNANERREKLIIQQKSAPWPFEYSIRHNRNPIKKHLEEILICLRFSILISFLDYESPIYLPLIFLGCYIFVLIITYIMWLFPSDFPAILSKKNHVPSLSLNAFYNLLVETRDSELSQQNKPLEELIAIGPGETEKLEFKASYWVQTEGESVGTQDKCLEDAVIKEVAGFLNTSGGTLLIGVNDDEPFEPTNTLEKDLSFSPKVSNNDELGLHISQILQNNIVCNDVSYFDCWKIRFPKYRGSTIIRIDVSKGPTYVKAKQIHKQKKTRNELIQRKKELENQDPIDSIKIAELKTKINKIKIDELFAFYRTGTRTIQPSQETWEEWISVGGNWP